MYQVASTLLVLASLAHSIPQSLWFPNSLFRPYLAAPQLDNATVAGKYLLKHSPYDGMKELLPAYGMSAEDVEGYLAGTHYMDVNIDGEAMVTILNSIKDAPEEDFALTYSQTQTEKETIPSPLNEEDTIEYIATVLAPNILSVSSSWSNGIREVTTYSFTGTTASVAVQLQEKNQLYPKYANAFYQKVDEDDKPVAPALGYYLLG